MGREVGTKALLFMEAYESKLASGFAGSIRSKIERKHYMFGNIFLHES